MSDPAASRQSLLQQLAGLGIGAGDTVMLHASLRSIGATEGGVSGLIETLCEAVGRQGTLLMVVGSLNELWDRVHEIPEADVEERAAVLASAPPFDVLSTPSSPDVGHLAEAFRQHPGTLVTNHPDCRFAALGHRARWLLEASTWDHYMGPDSPLARLGQVGGKVLRLGANDDTTTVLHWAEYVVPLAHKDAYTMHFRMATHPTEEQRRRAARVVDLRGGPDLTGPEGGSTIVGTHCLNNETGIVDWPGEDYFAQILKAYRAQGHGRHGQVGRAQSEAFDAAHLVAFGAAWMLTTFGPGDAARGRSASG